MFHNVNITDVHQHLSAYIFPKTCTSMIITVATFNLGGLVAQWLGHRIHDQVVTGSMPG